MKKTTTAKLVIVLLCAHSVGEGRIFLLRKHFWGQRAGEVCVPDHLVKLVCVGFFLRDDTA